MKYKTNCNHKYEKGVGLKKVYDQVEWDRVKTLHEITDKPVLGEVRKCVYCGVLGVNDE